MPWLINASQLDKFRKNQKSVMILDASLHINDRDPKQEFLNKHILDARFFDIDAFSDPNAVSPHTLILDEKLIAEKLSALGVRDDFKIILYDNSDLRSACRALWMFKMFGHNSHQLYVLDGGLAAWEKYGGKVASGDVTTTPKSYKVNLQLQHLSTLRDMKKNCIDPASQVIDMRHPVRYAGGPESRPGLRSGHIPGSFCFPYTIMFDRDGCFLPVEKIRKRLLDAGVDLQTPIISTCGSAITAPILDFVLDLIGHEGHSVYDGSWSEWGVEKLLSGETDLSERPIANSVD